MPTMNVAEDNKPHLRHDEHYIEKEELAVDYSGARAKDDPAEIKLVRKLDLFILPTLWIM